MRLVLALVFMAASGVHAANFYVRPNGGAYGAENGSDWSNAFDGFSDINWAGISAGDTVWVAGGTYGQTLAPTVSDISILRARTDATECTGAAGWDAGFASLVVMTPTATINYVNVDNVVISGRTTAGGGSRGWQVFNTFTGENSMVWFPSSQGSTVEYMHLKGPGHVTYSGDARGITVQGTSSDITIRNVKIEDVTTLILATSVENVLIEYHNLSDASAVNSVEWHPNGIYHQGVTGLTIRYGIMQEGDDGFDCGEGIFAEQSGGSSNIQIYGNVFNKISDTAKCIQFTAATANVGVYNNTFNDCVNTLTITGSGSITGTSTNKNNLVFDSTSMNTTGFVTGNNLTFSTPDPFVNLAGDDFHIVSNTGGNYPRQAGTDLSTVFTLDPDGVAYGDDTTWPVGAYAFDGDSPPASGAPNAYGVTARVGSIRAP